MNTEVNEYQKQALDFLTKTNTTFECKFLRNGSMQWDKDGEKRDIYQITIKRGGRSYTTEFGQSLSESLKYVDPHIKGREYTATGKPLKGGYKVNDLHFLLRECKQVKGTPPTEYDFLASMTKYNPGTFEDFCSDFGYGEDSRTAERTYNAVLNEWLRVSAMYSDSELQELAEIQ